MFNPNICIRMTDFIFVTFKVVSSILITIDATRRKMNPWGWGLFSLILTIPAIIVFMKKRKDKPIILNNDRNDASVRTIVILACIWLFVIIAFMTNLGSSRGDYKSPVLILAIIATGIILYFHYKQKKDLSRLIKMADYTSKTIYQFKNICAPGEDLDDVFEKKEIDFTSFVWYPFKTKNNENKYQNADLRFKISRNLASMEPKEREFLRLSILLFAHKKISIIEFEEYVFAFVYGEGKGAILEWEYSAHFESYRDAPSMVKFYQDKNNITVEGSINSLLRKVNEINESDPKCEFTKQFKERIGGGNHWLSSRDIENSIFNHGEGHSLILGPLEGSSSNLCYSGEGSLITIAPPGSGKTQCFVLPNMLEWKSSALVLDIKGEIFASTHKWRTTNVGKVYKFSPLDPQGSAHFNPLTSVRNEADFIWEDSRFLADMMIVPSNTSDPFWDNMARDVLTSAIAYVCDESTSSEDRPISKVLDIIWGIGWDDMIFNLKTSRIHAMRQMGHSMEDWDKRQKDSVLRTAQSSLSAWQGNRISRVTSKSDWSPKDLRKENITVYMCINPNEIDSYLSLIRVFIAQHIRALTSELPSRNSSPILFMLDELPRLKKMPPIEEALQVGRQYGIKLWMFAQSFGQIKDSYPDPDGLIGNCAIRTYMNLPINDEFTFKLSEQLGYRHDAIGNTKEKLVEPKELAGPKFKDTIIVLAANTKPAKINKCFAFQNEDLLSKMSLSNE